MSEGYEYFIAHARIPDRKVMEGGAMKKIYCTCGRIVDIDRDYFDMRMRLGKQVECRFCRNIRIGHEIEELNNHFQGIPEEDSGTFYV